MDQNELYHLLEPYLSTDTPTSRQMLVAYRKWLKGIPLPTFLPLVTEVQLALTVHREAVDTENTQLVKEYLSNGPDARANLRQDYDVETIGRMTNKMKAMFNELQGDEFKRLARLYAELIQSKKIKLMYEIGECSSEAALNGLSDKWILKDEDNIILNGALNERLRREIVAAIENKRTVINDVELLQELNRKNLDLLKTLNEMDLSLALLADIIDEVKKRNLDGILPIVLKVQDDKFKEFLNTMPPGSGKREADDYVVEARLDAKSTMAQFSHDVGKAKKRELTASESGKEKHNKTWFKKKETNEKSAQIEVVTQELLRLFRPESQPKTRLTVDRRQKTYVNSAEIKGYECFDDEDPLDPKLTKMINASYQKGEGRGMGQIMVYLLLLGENDAKFGNLGVNKDGQVVAIDGGQRLPNLTGFQGQFAITESVIRSLPRPGDYAPYNWIDYIAEQVPYARSRLTIGSENPAFRLEVNAAILNVLLLDETSLKRLVEHYVSKDLSGPLMREMIDRRGQLRRAAFANPSFIAFMNTAEAIKVKNEFVTNMHSFTMTAGERLVSDEEKKMQKEIIEVTFGEVKEDVNANISQLSVQPDVKKRLLQFVYLQKDADEKKKYISELDNNSLMMLKELVFDYSEIDYIQQCFYDRLKDKLVSSAQFIDLSSEDKSELCQLFISLDLRRRFEFLESQNIASIKALKAGLAGKQVPKLEQQLQSLIMDRMNILEKSTIKSKERTNYIDCFSQADEQVKRRSCSLLSDETMDLLIESANKSGHSEVATYLGQYKQDRDFVALIQNYIEKLGLNESKGRAGNYLHIINGEGDLYSKLSALISYAKICVSAYESVRLSPIFRPTEAMRLENGLSRIILDYDKSSEAAFKNLSTLVQNATPISVKRQSPGDQP